MLRVHNSRAMRRILLAVTTPNQARGEGEPQESRDKRSGRRVQGCFCGVAPRFISEEMNPSGAREVSVISAEKRPPMAEQGRNEVIEEPRTRSMTHQGRAPLRFPPTSSFDGCVFWWPAKSQPMAQKVTVDPLRSAHTRKTPNNQQTTVPQCTSRKRESISQASCLAPIVNRMATTSARAP